MATRAMTNRKTRVLVPPPKAGRPSLYKPEYCAFVEELGQQGKSPAQIAAILHVDRATMFNWAGVHDEFSQSLARAKTYEQAWWENHGQTNLKAKHYQAQIWRTSVAARFKDDYQERVEVHGHLDLAAIISAVVEAPADKAKQVKADVSLKDKAK